MEMAGSVQTAVNNNQLIGNPSLLARPPPMAKKPVSTERHQIPPDAAPNTDLRPPAYRALPPLPTHPPPIYNAGPSTIRYSPDYGDSPPPRPTHSSPARNDFTLTY